MIAIAIGIAIDGYLAEFSDSDSDSDGDSEGVIGDRDAHGYGIH